MVELPQCGHRPVQTSAVVVLGATQRPSMPPPSPPTPSISTPERALCEPIDLLALDQELWQDARAATDSQAREQRLRHGLHVLGTEALALAALANLYEVDPAAQDGFDKSVQAITRQEKLGGKLVVVGVGKSGHIGQKLVATFKSLAIHAVFLHPTEALHGDLGIIGPNDTLLFITYSGKTQELLLMLPHLDPSLPVILLTAHKSPESCEFVQHRHGAILLPAPVPEPEKVSFGVSAPTTSTTVALAVGDALALVAAKELHSNVSAVFAKNHPGGAIGAAARQPRLVMDVAIPLSDIPASAELDHDSLGMDVLRAGYESSTGWVRVGDRFASPSNIRGLARQDLSQPLDEVAGLLVPKSQMIALSADTALRQARNILHHVRSTPTEDDAACGPDSIIAVMEKAEIVGVVEVAKVVELTE